MQLPDLINGCFETGIGILAWTSVQAIRRDKEVKGINWFIQLWVTLWGLFNLYYYPHLGQWLSFTGGCVIFGANLTWLGHYFYYASQRKAQEASTPPFGVSA